MTKTHLLVLGFLSSSALLLGGCSNVKNSLGLEKDAPDEFAVIKRAPLEIPSNLTLPPPMPGTPRPQETNAVSQAQEAVFGSEKEMADKTSSAENLLLKKTGADQADPSIRATVNRETAELDERNEPVVKKLLKLGGKEQDTSATVIDAKKEYERIQQNKRDGKDITEGETPVIEE